MDLNDIDWNTLWRWEAERSHWNNLFRDAAANKTLWDKRADKFNKRVNRVKAGDHVNHAQFGEGVVVSSRHKKDDTEVVVAFEGAGGKRLLLSFAKLEKV